MKKLTEMGFFRMALFAIAVSGLMYTVSCGGGGGGDSAPATGTVSISMTDAATTDYAAVYVTVREVAVHRDGDGEGQWDVISSSSGKTYNLLDLVNGVQVLLGTKALPAGHYTQIRLKLTGTPDDSTNYLGDKHQYGNYFTWAVPPDNHTQVELKVPSGMQSGLKLIKGFDVVPNFETHLLLDFDAARSIVQAGASGTWILKPTIKILQTIEYCIIQGNAGQEGVLISAQTYNSSTDDVSVAAATVSAAGGGFKLYVDPGTYTIVSYKQGYKVYSAPAKVTAVKGASYTVNIPALALAETGTLKGLVTITGSSEQYPSAAISIRQAATVGGNTEMIEVKSINAENLATYSTLLPVLDAPATYTLVASSVGFADQTIPDISVSSGGTTTYNITFSK